MTHHKKNSLVVTEKKSCNNCIHRHSGCDRKRPSCKSCLERDLECRYATSNFIVSESKRSTSQSTSSLQADPRLPSSGYVNILPNSLRSSTHTLSATISAHIHLQEDLIRMQQRLIDELRVRSQLISNFDCDEPHLHHLICQSRSIFSSQSDEIKAELSLSTALALFVQARPDRMSVVLRFEPKGTQLCYISGPLQSWIGYSARLIQDHWDQNISVFSSPSRAARLHPILQQIFTYGTDGNHTFILERSSEYLLPSGSSGTFHVFSALFPDLAGKVRYAVSFITVHLESKPVVPPVVISSHCPTCSLLPCSDQQHFF